MAIRPIEKLPISPDRLATGNNLIKDSLQIAGLFPIDIKGNIQIVEPGYFLLNPTSWQESKSSNWPEHNIPGQSDPVLQWISGGPRIVSFDALVTNDISKLLPSNLNKKPGEIFNPVNKSKLFVGEIASKVAGVTIPANKNQDQDQIDKTGLTKLDISNYLNYYRSLLYPTYDRVDKPRRLRASPPLLVLFDGNAISKLAYSTDTKARVSSQHDLWVLSDLQINITKQLPNLAPMEALVTFKLIQYNVRSFDRNRFLR